MMKKKYNQQCLSLFVCLWLVCILVYTLTSVFVGNDGFWHMAMGRQITELGRVPHTAVGAWGGEKLAWVAQEWLYQFLIYQVFQDDMLMLCIFTMCLIAFEILLIGILSGIHKDIFAKPWAVVVYVLFGIFAMKSFVVPRPQSFSLLFTVLFVYQLRKLIVSDTLYIRHYVFFAVLGLLWANVHAGTAILGYLIPIGVVICYMITDKFAVFTRYFDIQHDKSVCNRVSVVACIMAVACMCTPNGLSGFLYPVYSMGDELMLSVVTEWAQPNINDVMGLCMYYVPFVAFYGWLFFSKTKMKLYDFIVISFLFVLAILHVRIVLYLLPVLVLLWIPYLSQYHQFGLIPRIKRIYTFPISVLCVGFILCGVAAMSQDAFAAEGYGNTEFFDTVREQAGDRMYNYYDIGSVLQYYDIPVFVDARYDPFSKKRMPDFIDTQYCDSHSAKFQEIMDKYDFTSVLGLQETAVTLYAKNHGYEKLAEFDTGVSIETKSGGSMRQVYEFWAKK